MMGFILRFEGVALSVENFFFKCAKNFDYCYYHFMNLLLIYEATKASFFSISSKQSVLINKTHPNGILASNDEFFFQ